MMFRHGLIIGKFYPPHNGHVALARAAVATCTTVTVVVMAADRERMPLAARVAWLTEALADAPGVRVAGVVDNLPVDYGSDEIWAAQVALMRVGLAQVGRGEPDAVFSSEDYGAELARRFGAADVRLDRGALPVSGTAVRADPVGAWWDLPDPTRAGLALRVVLVGAESTGKSTLAARLAKDLRARGGAWGATRLVTEYGRDWWMARVAALRARGLAWDAMAFAPADFAHIAATQTAREDAAARATGPVLIGDTDAFATALWAERYLGAPAPEVPARVDHLPGRRLYLLLGVAGAPFVQDGWRDGERIRGWMDARFRSALTDAGARWVALEGDWDARERDARTILDGEIEAFSVCGPDGRG